MIKNATKKKQLANVTCNYGVGANLFDAYDKHELYIKLMKDFN